MRIQRLMALVPVVGAGILAGCLEGTTPSCEGDDGGQPAIFVMITDSVTGTAAAANAKVVAQAGAFADSVMGTDQIRLGLGLPLPVGTYIVTVTKTGYQTWAQGDVVVAEDACGVPVGPTLHAKLQPQ